MARIRTIKPSFFKSDDVSALPLRARLTWIGLWTQCDDQGRTKDHARLIKADIWPLDPVSLADIEEDLAILAANGRIVRYEVDGTRFLAITNWSDHQSINRPTKSKIPPPPGSAPAAEVPNTGAAEPRGTGSRKTPDPLTESTLSTHAGKGRERKGREGSAREELPSPNGAAELDYEPPQTCPEHTNTRHPPPCGPCASARKLHQAWQAEQRKRLAAAPKCRLHRGELADNCRPCRSEELAPA